MGKHWGGVDGKDEAEVRAWWGIQCSEDFGGFNIGLSRLIKCPLSLILKFLICSFLTRDDI
jgi:hypothetical protein